MSQNINNPPLNFTLKVLEARDLIKRHLLTRKVSPYAKITVLQTAEKCKTNVISRDPSPVWNWEKILTVNSPDDVITIEIWSQHTFHSDFLGQVKLKLTEIPDSQTYNKWLSLKRRKDDKEDVTGEIHLEYRFEGKEILKQAETTKQQAEIVEQQKESIEQQTEPVKQPEPVKQAETPKEQKDHPIQDETPKESPKSPIKSLMDEIMSPKQTNQENEVETTSGIPPPPAPGSSIPPPPPTPGTSIPQSPNSESSPDSAHLIPVRIDKISNANASGTIWAELNKDDDVELNLDSLNEKFKKEDKPAEHKIVNSEVVNAEKAQLRIINLKRAEAIELLLRRYELDATALRDFIFCGKNDDEAVPIELLSQLVTSLAGKGAVGEEEFFRNYDGSKGELVNSAEKFLSQLYIIPRVGAKLVLLQYEVELEESIQEATKNREIVDKALHSLKDPLFKKFLQIVLAVANHMNQDNYNRDAKGFQLSSLLKLSEVKAQQSNLLHFLVEFIKEKKSAEAQDTGVLTHLLQMEPLWDEAAKGMVNLVTLLPNLLLQLRSIEEELNQNTTEEESFFKNKLQKMSTDITDYVRQFNQQLEAIDEEIQYYGGNDYVPMDAKKVEEAINELWSRQQAEDSQKSERIQQDIKRVSFFINVHTFLIDFKKAEQLYQDKQVQKQETLQRQEKTHRKEREAANPKKQRKEKIKPRKLTTSSENVEPTLKVNQIENKTIVHNEKDLGKSTEVEVPSPVITSQIVVPSPKNSSSLSRSSSTEMSQTKQKVGSFHQLLNWTIFAPFHVIGGFFKILMHMKKGEPWRLSMLVPWNSHR